MNISWGALKESNNFVKKEADEKPKADDSGLPPLDGSDAPADKPAPAPKADAKAEKAPAPKPAEPAPAPAPEADAEDADKAQADAAKKKAELEKAKAEKAQAEEELEQHSYVKLKSSGGTQFMLGKILDHAFKTNTIDALASEMAQKLKITTPEDAAAFEKDMALYKTIPGMPELIGAIKSVAVSEPKQTEEEPAE
jgi:hypothetical protein